MKNRYGRVTEPKGVHLSGRNFGYDPLRVNSTKPDTIPTKISEKSNNPIDLSKHHPGNRSLDTRPETDKVIGITPVYPMYNFNNKVAQMDHGIRIVRATVISGHSPLSRTLVDFLFSKNKMSSQYTIHYCHYSEN